MRELPAILLTVFLMTSVCLGASEVLTNDTGRTATGVVVTFSGKVTLASWDDSVFPDANPGERGAISFAFSGGSLANRGRFKIAWSPSSATIVDIQWKEPSAGLDAAGINWESLPVTISYAYDPPLTAFVNCVTGATCGNPMDISLARYWGRDGIHVKAVRVGLSEAGLAVNVELHDGDKWGNYGYIVAFHIGNSRLLMFLYPQDMKATRLAADGDGKWTELGAVSATSFTVAGRVMKAWFPSALYSKQFTAETLTASPLDMHLDCIQGARRELFSYSGRGSATWIGREPAIAEIPGLESVGNPFRRRYPGEGALAFPRTVWDMQAWNGRIYLGHGDTGSNAGPIDVWYYAPDQARFVSEFSVDDEQIGHYCPIGDSLLIPGYDAMESWDLGNLYVNEGTGWQKLRTIPNAIHVYDLAMYENRLYAAGSAQLPGSTPLDAGGFLGVSDDGGRSWGIELHLGPFSEDGVTRVRDASDPGVARFTSLFELQGKLFASGWGASRIYELGPGGFSVLRVDPFPGTASQFDEVPLLPPNEIDLSMKELYRLYADPKVGGYIARSVQFSGQLVYIGQGIGLFEATAMQDGQIRRVLDLGAAWQPRDLIATGDQLYALCVSAMDSGFQSRVYVTRDLNEWSVVTDFAADAPAFSIEVLDGYLYLGLGGAYLSSGNIYRVKLSGE